MRARTSFMMAALICGLAAGCGTIDTRMSVEQLTAARISVEAAERADAKTYSGENLRHAQDALAIANDAYTGGDYERTLAFSKEATRFARVAKAVTDQKRAEVKLAAARLELENLRKQTDSGPGTPAVTDAAAGSPTIQAAPATEVPTATAVPATAIPTVIPPTATAVPAATPAPKPAPSPGAAAPAAPAGR